LGLEGFEMEAGWDLDRWMAREIMGWIEMPPEKAKDNPDWAENCQFVYTVYTDLEFVDYKRVYFRSVMAGDFSRWAPSLFEQNAWSVVEKLKKNGYAGSVSWNHREGKYSVTFKWGRLDDKSKWAIRSKAKAATMPLAVCIAALNLTSTTSV
jgi:hypothetical protein